MYNTCGMIPLRTDPKPLTERAQEMLNWRKGQMMTQKVFGIGIDRCVRSIRGIELGHWPPSWKTYRNYLAFRAKVERKLEKMETIAKDGGPKWEQ